MPLYLNSATVTVIREARRVKVPPSKPNAPRPYDFTEAEVAAAEDAGVIMTPYSKVRPAAVVESPVVEKAETPAQKRAREKAEAETAAEKPARGKKAVADDLDSDDL
jgi:hypothetical protein